jgi:hypothetical protein
VKTLLEGAKHEIDLIRTSFEAEDSYNSGWIPASAFEAVLVKFGVAGDVAMHSTAMLQQSEVNHTNKGCVNYQSFLGQFGQLLQSGSGAQPQVPSSSAPLQEQRWSTWGSQKWRTMRRPSVCTPRTSIVL